MGPFMANIKEKVSISEEDINGDLPSEIQEIKKSCVDCHTTTTPLWRGGPAGRKTLCNACGIRQMKIRRALGIDSKSQMMKKSNTNKVKSPWKMSLMGLGRKWVLKKSTTKWHEKKMNQMGEEEQAAVLLMALSCPSFFSN